MNRIQKSLNDLTMPRLEQDCARIVQVSLRHGFVLTLKQAEMIWEEYSEDYAAGWMTLPKTDEELWEILNEEV